MFSFYLSKSSIYSLSVPFYMDAIFYLFENIIVLKMLYSALCIVFLPKSFVLLVLVCIFHVRGFPPMCVDPWLTVHTSQKIMVPYRR